MFMEISDRVRRRMAELAEIDARDRADGTPRLERLRQIPEETGKFLALLAATAPEGMTVEIGTSAGYSTLWLAQACLLLGRTITTFECLPDKARLARETIEIAGLKEVIDLVEGDARDHLGSMRGISFCFLDAEKEVYKECYDLVVPNMVSGGLLVADNAINHRETLQPLIDEALADRRLDAMVVPVGKGELVCRLK